MIWRPAYHRRIAQSADGVTTVLSFVLSYVLWSHLRTNVPALFGLKIVLSGELYLLAAGFAVVWVAILAKLGAYEYQRFTSLRHEAGVVAKAAVIGSLLVFVAIFMLRVGYVARTYVCIFFVSNVACLMVEKVLVFAVAKRIRESGRDRKRIIVAGNGEAAREFIVTTEANLGWGLDIVGAVPLEGNANVTNGKPILGNVSEIENILHEHQVDEVIICASAGELGRVEAVFDVCHREGVQVRINSHFFGHIARRLRVDDVYGLPIISFMSGRDNEWKLYTKRLIDILVSLSALVALAPVFLSIAVLIRLTSPGPVFYRWKVVGRNKRPFVSWKFRTMVVNADSIKEQLIGHNEMSGPVFKMKDDPRITAVGKILRKYSLDELPQLWSVLKGDMSLVGPRPPLQSEVQRFDSWHRRKLSVKPGITCVWQANGRNRIHDFNQWCTLDLQYIDNWSLWLDFKILFKTFSAVFKGTGH